MIEEYLKKEHASVAANNLEVLQALVGETIKAVLDNVPSGEGWATVFIFESGNTFEQHNKGGFWINNKEESRAKLEKYLEAFRQEHENYKRISQLLAEI